MFLSFESTLACKKILWLLVLLLMDSVFFGTTVDGKKRCSSLWRLGLILKTKINKQYH
jgi:hypothetical protein